MTIFKTIKSLESELENRQSEVVLGTKLIFKIAGCITIFTVTDLFDGGFEVSDNDDGYKEDFYFGELQTNLKFY